jgi:hypothetical protein
MSTQYAGTPTGTGPALPTYLSDADIQAAHENALCNVDSLADWLMGKCMCQAAYAGSSKHYADERALILDYSKATNMSTPDLLALAMGLASNPRARIAAMDELSVRYLRAQNLPGALV